MSWTRFAAEPSGQELAMGREVEREHSDTIKWLAQKLESGHADKVTDELINEVADRIARDHLKELPDYYTRLKKMEAGN